MRLGAGGVSSPNPVSCLQNGHDPGALLRLLAVQGWEVAAPGRPQDKLETDREMGLETGLETAALPTSLVCSYSLAKIRYFLDLFVSLTFHDSCCRCLSLWDRFFH